MEERLLVQISAGKGPAECTLAVAYTLGELEKAVIALQGSLTYVQEVYGAEKGTIESVLLEVTVKQAASFVREWQGSIQWIFSSPYRPGHKRRNWFTGIHILPVPAQPPAFRQEEVVYQTLRASGPGGQHVNKTETAVRATHLPSGLSVTASDSRSQAQNKQLALQRLQLRYYWQQHAAVKQAQQDLWWQHHNLERGNPVKVFRK
jgi:peptide chain release factor